MISQVGLVVAWNGRLSCVLIYMTTMGQKSDKICCPYLTTHMHMHNAWLGV